MIDYVFYMKRPDPQEMNLNVEREFNQFITIHYNQFYRFVYFYTFRREDAQDILQEAFTKIYFNYPEFRNQSSVMTWCYRIIRNQAIDFLRKKKLEGFFDPLIRVFKASDRVQPEVMAETNRVNKEIEKALNLLKPREKEVFTMRHYQDLSVKEISGITGLGESAVKVRLFRTARKLKKILEGCNLLQTFPS
jgi:RNA polymerase sigma-70 factor (ECF subfamily)